MDEIKYAVTLTVYADPDEVTEVTQKLGAIMVGYIEGQHDTSLHVSAFTPEGDLLAEEELEL